MLELFPRGLRGGRPPGRASSSPRTPTPAARSASGSSSAARAATTSKRAGRTGGARSTGRSASGRSGSGRRGRRRPPTRSRSSSIRAARSAPGRTRRRSSVSSCCRSSRPVAARRRLRLRRALDRGGAARLQPGARGRHRGAVDRGDPRERRAQRCRVGRARSSLPTPGSRRRTSSSRTSRSRRCEALSERLDAARLVTSGYLASEQPRLPGFEHVERRQLDGWAGVGPLRTRRKPHTISRVATFRVDFLGCKVSHADAHEVREALLR